MHELRDAEVLVSVEELFPRDLRFAVRPVTVDVPLRIIAVGVCTDVVWNVGNDELRGRHVMPLVVLKMVVVKFHHPPPFLLVRGWVDLFPCPVIVQIEHAPVRVVDGCGACAFCCFLVGGVAPHPDTALFEFVTVSPG